MRISDWSSDVCSSDLDREQWLQALDRPVVILTPESLPSGATSLDAWARQHGRDPKNVRRINPAFAGGRIAKARGQTLQVLVPRKSGEAPAAQPAPPRISTLESGRASWGERGCKYV